LCETFSENPVFHDMSKHIEMKYHYIGDMVQRGAMKLQYIATGEQIDDVLTKPLGKSSHGCKAILAWWQESPPMAVGISAEPFQHGGRKVLPWPLM
jgi:hypothetical protein